MKTLVTGADGFIGSHLTEKLVKLGYNVKAFVFYNSLGNWGWLEDIDPYIRKEIEIISGDIRDLSNLRIATRNCNNIIHLAALIAIPFSYISPESYVDTNIKGTLNILQAAKDNEVDKLIHTSTSEVYGTAKFVPISEDHPLSGQSPYSASKISADQMAISFNKSFGTPVSIIRPFNTYGPRQSARAIIPTIITQIANGEKNIKIGSIDPTRDFNYVSDTVNGFVKILESSKSDGQIFNIGSGYEFSIKEVIEIIEDLMDVKINLKIDRSRIRPKESEVDRLLADNKKARNVLNWKPEFEGKKGFKAGLEKTISWVQKADNLRKYKHQIYNV